MNDFNDIDWELLVNGVAKHGESFAEFTRQKTTQEWNEINKGGGIRASSEDNSVVKYLQGGFYDNSLNNQTVYVGGGIKKRFGNDFYADFGIEGNLLTGYENPITPAIMPIVTIGKKDYGALDLKYVPKTENNPSVVTLNLSIPFED